MPNIWLHNTMTRRKEEFVPADPKRVTMYLCGPTIYSDPHIGNAVNSVACDVLFRLLRHAYGEDAVIYARNFTDIDDKIIAAAAKEGVAIDAITEKYGAGYRAAMSALAVLPPTLEPTATGHIPEIIALIEKLIAMGAAYRAQSGVYFSVESDAEYGKLSGRAQEDLRAGARVEGEDDKRASSDFALWKAVKPGEPSWEAPFGDGRPGWHIECSAMIAKSLGETIDIHAGGQDLIFPHHENEIAQSETATGHPLARYWIHNGMLAMGAEKMSKSLGNIVTVRELLAGGWAGETIRFALLSAHYRTPPAWSEDLLKQAKASLDRLYGALERVWDAETIAAEPPPAFMEALGDDLNTPKAIAELFALASAANKAATPQERAHVKADLLTAGALMGVLQSAPTAWFKGGGGDDAAIEKLVAQRADARRAKNWTEADRVRGELDALGIVVMDDPKSGTSTWRRA